MKSFGKSSRRFLAIFLAIIMFVQLLPPAQSFAKSTPVNDGPVLTDVVKPIIDITGEDDSRREGNIKHFLLEDKSYEAVVYADPVHYKENGKWLDIDNSITEEDDAAIYEASATGETGLAVVAAADKKIFTNSKNDFKIKVAKNTSASQLVRITKGKFELGWSIAGLSSVTGEKIAKDLSKQSSLSENEKKLVLPNLQEDIKFIDALPGTDITYQIQSSKVKENFVLKTKQTEPVVYTINLDLKNLKAKLNADNSISFMSSDKKLVEELRDQKYGNSKSGLEKADPESITPQQRNDMKEAAAEYKKDYSDPVEIYKIPAPMMYDAKGEECRDFRMELVALKSGTGYTFTMVPDETWLQDTQRAYPVTIDPTVVTTLDSSLISDAHVSSGYATTNYYNSVMVKTGNPSAGTSGINRTYVKLTLPTITSSSIITDAVYKMKLYNTYNNSDVVNLYEVTGSWTETGITWNNKASYASSKVEDYSIINGTNGTEVKWDITSLAKGWYSNKVYNGLMLRNQDETTGSYIDYYSADTSSTYSTYRPTAVITYVNNEGFEDTWTYHSAGIGRGGEASVNDYTGNAIYTHDDMATDGSRMPISINHVWNSSNNALNLCKGLGWRLNVDQRIKGETIGTKDFYSYTDEDGSKHYFKEVQGASIYHNEDGLNITMTVNLVSTEKRYIVKDKSGSLLYFNTGGKLTEIDDEKGNVAIIAYDVDKQIASVTDGAGRVFPFVYDAAGNVGSIADPAGRKTSYTYTTGLLTKITYPDGKYTVFTYSANNMTSAVNFDGNSVEFAYSTIKPYRITKLSEKNTSDASAIRTLSMTYGFNTTKFTDNKGRVNTYQFNDFGNTVGLKDQQGYAAFYGYNDGSLNNELKGKVTAASKLQKSILNYLQNHSFELAGTWTEGFESGATGSIAIDTVEKNYGNKSAKISNTNTSGAHLYSHPTLTLIKGNTYNISGYVKTAGLGTTDGTGAFLRAGYQSAAGVYTYAYTPLVTGTANWQRIETEVTIPTGAIDGSLKIDCGVKGTTGTAYFDAIQLEDGKMANRYNMLENTDLRYGTGVPTSWLEGSTNEASETKTTTADVNPGLDNNVYTIVGKNNLSKSLRQDIAQSGVIGDTYTFGAWAKASSVPIGDPILQSGRHFAVVLEFYSNSVCTEKKWLEFNQDSLDWQYVSGSYTATKPYDSFKYYLTYYKNQNVSFFDGAQLYKEEFESTYSYDALGNNTTVNSVNKDQSSTVYDTTNNKNNITSVTDEKGNSTSATYDTENNLASVTTTKGVKNEYTYDGFGNALTAKIKDSEVIPNTISTSSTYSGIYNSNYMDTMTDSEGNVTSYAYNFNKGLVDSVTDVNGNALNYAYDSNSDDVTSVVKSAKLDGTSGTSATPISNSYTYENDDVKTINHNGFSYTFGFDKYGNNTNVNVGAQPLITNTFDNSTGNITKSTYGNNDYVDFTYDSLDRVNSVSYNGTKSFEYDFDGNGNLGYSKDIKTGVSFRYLYDILDRLSKFVDSRGNAIQYTFDKNSNVTKVDESFKTGTVTSNYSTNYEYDEDDRPTKSILHNGNTLITAYDGLGRMTSKTLNIGSNGLTSYIYKTKAGSTTEQTTKLASTTNGTDKIDYTYDKGGNITKIIDGLTEVTYVYNELNEMVRENNGYTGKTTIYFYDQGGNILKKEVYDYTLDVIPTVNKTIISYGYDSVWKDKLISYNGNAITSDAIGNTKTYDGWNFVWEAGRQLKSMDKAGKSLSFGYNDSGIRTSKTVDGVTTDYILEGNKVVRETQGTTKIIHYSYDSEGRLVSMNLTNSTYPAGAEFYYIYNGQGDVIGLLDSIGTKVVTYTYDSWGKPVTTTGTLATTVGVDNSYRYRGYGFDSETGLYYLQSRYYNSEWGRFISADDITGSAGEILTPNMFAYCRNNPVNHSDPDGDWVLDAIFLGADIAQFIKKPSLGNAGWVLLSVVCFADATGAGSATLHALRGVKFSARIIAMAKKISKFVKSFKRASKGIKEYSKLTKELKGTGLKAHHIVEKRLASTLGIKNINSMLSVAVTTTEHQVFTNAWRKLIPYGTKYGDLSKGEIWRIAQKVYKGRPELLKAAKKTIYN